MQPADLYAFSGTGNTYLVAERLRAALAAEGPGARLFRLEKTDPQTVAPDRALGIVFPVACFGTYPVVMDFIHGLPAGNGNGVFVVDTLGGNSGKFPGRLREIFAAKGYQPLGTAEILMPDNIFSGSPRKREANRRRIEEGLQAAETFARALRQGTTLWQEKSRFAGVWDALNRWTFSSRLPQGLRPKVRAERCTGCGLCVRHCPAENIRLADNRAQVEKHCQFCLRCRGLCPTGAIRTWFTQPYLIAEWREALNAGESTCEPRE